MSQVSRGIQQISGLRLVGRWTAGCEMDPPQPAHRAELYSCNGQASIPVNLLVSSS